ncbi:hypothetical protein EDC19_0604 [Natranaerovirga hydrolytica]|uniref:Uncharacterized protein n=1 Tax=Natranaerovirga hydrolytica TaxID=680378 RepID=A0A4R1MY94_9FIRM|nr:hypothetical protein [Natranaerovirga hydrolytica]TCK98186.1 hypothetical protein EDC19_0604 [Natranaerovirga hydrolytica]
MNIYSTDKTSVTYMASLNAFITHDKENQTKEIHSLFYGQNVTPFDPYNDLVDWSTPLKDVGKTTIDRSNNELTLNTGANIDLKNGYNLLLGTHGFQLVGNIIESTTRSESAAIGVALTNLIRIANGQLSQKLPGVDLKDWSDNAIKGLKSIGIDPSKPFILNGTDFQLKNGVLVTKESVDLKIAFEKQMVQNRSFSSSDKKSQELLDYYFSYYAYDAPDEVSKAWELTLRNTDINPFPPQTTNSAFQLSVEKHNTTGDGKLFGNSVASTIKAVEEILERNQNPIDSRDEELLEQEKIFYETFLGNLQAFV